MHLLHCTKSAGLLISLLWSRQRLQAWKKTMTRKTNTLYDRYRRWRRYRETVRELQGLSTHELNDLGINRVDISRLAREASRI